MAAVGSKRSASEMESEVQQQDTPGGETPEEGRPRKYRKILVEGKRPLLRVHENKRTEAGITMREVGTLLAQLMGMKSNATWAQVNHGELFHSVCVVVIPECSGPLYQAQKEAGNLPYISTFHRWSAGTLHTTVSPVDAQREGGVYDCWYRKRPKSFIYKGEPGDAAPKKPPPKAHCLKEGDLWLHGYPVDPTIEGYVATKPSGKPDDADKVFAIDCEMCLTASGHAVTRVAILDGEGECILDQMVRPREAIVSYLTEFSGVTEAMLEGVTTTLEDVQQQVLTLIPAEAILVGHSVDNDLRALRLVHTNVADTSLLYPHWMGPPMRFALRQLAWVHCRRSIQGYTPRGTGGEGTAPTVDEETASSPPANEANTTGGSDVTVGADAGTNEATGAAPSDDATPAKGRVGHCPIEDARASLDLFRKKVNVGPLYGTDTQKFNNILLDVARDRDAWSVVCVDRENVLWRYAPSNPNLRRSVSSDEAAVEATLGAIPEGGKPVESENNGPVQYPKPGKRTLAVVHLRGYQNAADNDADKEAALVTLNEHLGQLVTKAPAWTAFIVICGAPVPQTPPTPLPPLEAPPMERGHVMAFLRPPWSFTPDVARTGTKRQEPESSTTE